MSVDEDKIKKALSDKRWDYRTVEGLAKELGISADEVKSFLESRRDIVWKSNIPDRNGRDLYTLNERKPESKDFWRNITNFISKSSS